MVDFLTFVFIYPYDYVHTYRNALRHAFHVLTEEDEESEESEHKVSICIHIQLCYVCMFVQK